MAGGAATVIISPAAFLRLSSCIAIGSAGTSIRRATIVSTNCCVSSTLIDNGSAVDSFPVVPMRRRLIALMQSTNDTEPCPGGSFEPTDVLGTARGETNRACASGESRVKFTKHSPVTGSIDATLVIWTWLPWRRSSRPQKDSACVQFM